MKRRSNRPGFTLVEMLVATALIIFIMVILSEAFVQGIGAFSVLKGIGEMEGRLRGTAITLRGDLVPDHFEGRRRLSDPLWVNQGPPREGFFSIIQGATPTFSPNPAGPGLVTVTVPSLTLFNPASSMQLAIQPGSVLLVDAGIVNANGQSLQEPDPTNPLAYPAPVVQAVNPFTNSFTVNLNKPHGQNFSIRVIRYFEGIDPDGLPSTRAVDHQLNFTVKLRGNRREDFFSANVPSAFLSLASQNNFFNQSPDANFQDSSTEYASQWAEVAYFLVPTGTNANNTPLYALYRSQYVLVPNNNTVISPGIQTINGAVTLNQPQDQFPYAEMSCQKASGNFAFYPPAPGVEYLDFNNPSDVSQPTSTLTYSTAAAPQGTTMVQVQALNGPGWQIQPGYFLVLDGGTSSEETVFVNQVNQAANPPTFNVAQPLFFNHPPQPSPSQNFPIQTVRRAFLSAVGTGAFPPFAPVGPPSALGFPAWQGNNRLGFNVNVASLWGATLLLTDVVSFDVQVFPDPSVSPFNDFVDLSTFPVGSLSAPGTYDTAPLVFYNPAIPNTAPNVVPTYPIKAIQITLRVWNLKTQQTRQITMIQDM